MAGREDERCRRSNLPWAICCTTVQTQGRFRRGIVLRLIKKLSMLEERYYFLFFIHSFSAILPCVCMKAANGDDVVGGDGGGV